MSPRWLIRHVLLVAALATCWGFGTWQLGRAIRRHSVLNWSYTVEWTLFGAFSVLCWAWFLRDDLRGEQPEPAATAAREVHFPPAPPVTDDEDPELAAYNRYLAQLNAKDTA